VVNGTNVTDCNSTTNGTDNNTSGGNGTKKNTDDKDADVNIDGFNLNELDLTFGIFEALPGLKKLLTFSGPLNFT